MPLANLHGMRIEAIAAYAPKNIVTNNMIAVRLQEELVKINIRRKLERLPSLSEKEAKIFKTNPAWIKRYIGFIQRRHDIEGLGTIGLAEKAARLIIERYGLKPEQIDCIIFGTVTPSYLYSPPDSSLLQARLGIPAYLSDRVPREFESVDISKACSTWLAALADAYRRISLGLSKVVLLIGADTMSTAINWQDRAFATVLGDAGTATLCTAVPLEEDWFGLNNFWSFSDGSLAHIIKTPIGGSLQPLTDQQQLDNYKNRLWMDGAIVKEQMVPFIGGPAIQSAMEKSGWNISEIDIATFHEANLSMNHSVVKLWQEIGFQGKILDAGGMFGNTTSASVPLALAINGDELKVGCRFNWNVFGGGLTAVNVMGQIKHPVQTFLDV